MPEQSQDIIEKKLPSWVEESERNYCQITDEGSLKAVIEQYIPKDIQDSGHWSTSLINELFDEIKKKEKRLFVFTNPETGKEELGAELEIASVDVWYQDNAGDWFHLEEVQQSTVSFDQGKTKGKQLFHRIRQRLNPRSLSEKRKLGTSETEEALLERAMHEEVDLTPGEYSSEFVKVEDEVTFSSGYQMFNFTRVHCFNTLVLSQEAAEKAIKPELETFKVRKRPPNEQLKAASSQVEAPFASLTQQKEQRSSQFSTMMGVKRTVRKWVPNSGQSEKTPPIKLLDSPIHSI